jgi:hypothetical protein
MKSEFYKNFRGRVQSENHIHLKQQSAPRQGKKWLDKECTIGVCYAVERGEKMRVNMNVPDDLLKQIDEQAENLKINRTAYIVMSMAQKVQQDQIMNAMPDLKQAIFEIEKTLQSAKKDGGQVIEKT